MSDLVELPVPPIEEDGFSVAADGTHVISVHDYLADRQDLPGGAKIIEARIDNVSDSTLRERQRGQTIRSGQHLTLEYPRGATNVELVEQDGFAVSAGEVLVELTLGVPL